MTSKRSSRIFPSWILIGIGILLISTPSSVMGDSILDRFSPEHQKKLLAGDVIFEYVKNNDPEKEGIGHGQASAIINKPIETCYKILSDFGKKAQFYPRLIKSDIIKTQENKIWVQERLDFRITKIDSVVIQDMTPELFRVDFRMDQTYPHNLKDTGGHWYFEKLDDQKALLTYAVTKADIGFPVPKFILKALTQRDLPGVVEHAKKRIESNGTWTKKD